MRRQESEDSRKESAGSHMMFTEVMKDRSLVYISIAVIGVHLFVLLWSSLSFERRPSPKISPRLLVKTISLNPKPKPQPKAEIKPPEKPIAKVESIPQVEAPKIEVQPEKPKPKPAAKKKEVPAPPVPKKTETKKADVKPKTAMNPKQKELLAKVQEKIAKVQSVKNTPVKLPMPDLIALDAKPELNDIEIGYRDELAGRLKLMLRLPEFGEVKIKLTLDKSGRVIKVIVISSESDLNRKYVENELPSLPLPAFGNNFNGMTEYTFPITLSNEI